MDATELALAGGEDYELLFSAPAQIQISGATPIGELTQSPGIIVLDAKGQKVSIAKTGFRHFS